MRLHRPVITSTSLAIALASPLAAAPITSDQAMHLDLYEHVPLGDGSDAFQLDALALGKKVVFQVHTDVPDLPRAATDDLPDLGSFVDEQWTFGATAKDLPGYFFGNDAYGRTLILEESRRGGGLGSGGPGRVHTDVPDLPAIGFPNTSADPIRKPGWGDWTNIVHDRPQLESSTIPSPGASLVFVLGGVVAANRRRRR